MAQLFEDNVIDREEFRDMLVQGEILPSAAEQPTQEPEPAPAPVEQGPSEDQINLLINALMQ
jgi:hypothetical protein